MRGRDNGNAELNIMAIAQWSIRDEGLAIILIIISGPMGLLLSIWYSTRIPKVLVWSGLSVFRLSSEGHL